MMPESPGQKGTAMSKKYDLITVGVAILDSMITGFDPATESPAGFRAKSSTLSVGGDAANEAIAAAKLGLKTAILCYLGNDTAGNTIAEYLEAGGVSTEYVIRTDDHPTPVTTIFVKEDGNRRSITNDAHAYNFHPELYTDILRDTRAVILGSLFRAPFNDPEVIQQFLEAAKAQDVLAIADTKLPNFRKLSLEDIADSLPLIDYITPNETEAEYYSGKTDVDSMADVFTGFGARNVIIKLGPKGCYFQSKDPESNSFVPTFDLETVDATGAGDNFIAGFASEILRGSDTVSALRFANACGAICTTAIGAGTALRDREQVLNILKYYD